MVSDENKKRYTEEMSYKLIANLRAIRGSIDTEIEKIKATLWVPREYETIPQQRSSYDPPPSIVVEPSASASFLFFVRFQIPGTEMLGLPETKAWSEGFERIFFIEELRVNDEDAPYFVIEQFSISQRLFLSPQAGVQAARFANSSPAIPINYYADAGQSGLIVVRNTSDEPRSFRAVLKGREQPEV
jgi:hypothetical protein